MAESLLSELDLKQIAKEFATQAPKNALWTGETAEVNLLAGGQRNAEFIAVATERLAKLATRLANEMEPVCETKFTTEASPYEITPAQTFISSLKCEEHLILPWHDAGTGLKGLVLLERTLFFQFYCALYGGQKASPKTGKLSSLENTFYNRLISSVCESFQAIMNGFFPITLQADPLIGDNEELGSLRWPFDCLKVVVTLTGENASKGNLIIAIPTDFFQAAQKGPKALQEETEDRAWIETVGPALKDEPLAAPLSIMLGTFKIPLKQAMDLKVGEIFPITAFADGYPVSLNNRSLFRVSMGALDGRRAIKVLSMEE